MGTVPSRRDPTPQEELFPGFGFLLDHALAADEIRASPLFLTTRLSAHPFGLPIPAVFPPDPFGLPPIEFVGNPKEPNSVNCFTVHLVDTMRMYGLGGWPRYLRVIGAEISQEFRGAREVYFEVGMAPRILLVGGCATFGVWEKLAREDLARLFRALASMYDVEPDMVLVEAERALPAIRTLRSTVAATVT